MEVQHQRKLQGKVTKHQRKLQGRKTSKSGKSKSGKSKSGKEMFPHTYIDYAKIDEFSSYELEITLSLDGIAVTVIPIDQVLMPNTKSMTSTLEEQGEFTILLSLIERAGLGEVVDTRTPLTLFGADSL